MYVLVLNGKTTVESQNYWFMRACYWPQIYHVFLVFRFQAEFAQNKDNIDFPWMSLWPRQNLFLVRRGGGGIRICLYPAFYQTVTCSWNADDWIRKRYRNCYVIRTFNKGLLKPLLQILQIVKSLPFHILVAWKRYPFSVRNVRVHVIIEKHRAQLIFRNNQPLF